MHAHTLHYAYPTAMVLSLSSPPPKFEQAQPSTATRMGPWFSTTSSYLQRAGRYILLFLISAYFAYCDGSNPFFLKLDEYTRGAAPKPYQYRELMMYVFRWLLRVEPITSLARHLESLHHDPYRLIFMIISLVAILGATLATRATLVCLTGDRIYSFWASLTVIFMAQFLLVSGWGASFELPYDVPSMFFFALGILLIVSRRWAFYYPLFVLATFNRETTCFITVFYAVWEWVRLAEAAVPLKIRALRIMPSIAIQAFLWLAIKVYLSHKYAYNPVETHLEGGMFANMLFYNLRELVKPWQWPLFASIAAFSLPLIYIQRRWIQLKELQYASAAVLGLSFCGLLIVGVITELRIFADWIIPVTLCGALIVHNRFRPVNPKVGNA